MAHLLELFRGSADQQLAGGRIGIDVRLAQVAFVGEQPANGQTCSVELDIVELEDLQDAFFRAELFEDFLDLCMLLGPGHGDELVAVAVHRQVDPHALLLEHVPEDFGGRVGVDVFERVELQLKGAVEGRSLLDLLDQLVDLLVLERRSVGDQAVVGRIERELHVALHAEQVLDGRQHVARVGRGDPVDLESRRLFDRVAIHFFDRVADFFVILRQRGGHDRPGSIVDGDHRLGNQGLEDIEGGVGIRLFEPVDDRGRFNNRGHRGRVLLNRALDRVGVALVGPDDQGLARRVGNELRVLADHGIEQREQRGDVFRLHRVDRHHAVSVEPTVGFDLVDGRLDRRVVFGIGPGDQLRGVLADSELGLRDNRREDLHRGGGAGRPQRIDGDRRLLLFRSLLGQLIQRRLDLFVFRRAGQRDQLASVAAGIDRRLGHGLHQHADRRLGVDRLDCVDLHPGRRLCRLFLAHLLDGLLDQLMIGGPGPGDQLPRVRPDAELGLGHDQAEQGSRLGRRRRIQRIDHHSRGRLFRLFLRKILNRRLDLRLLVAPGPDDQLVGIVAGSEPGQRECARQKLHRAGRRRFLQGVNHDLRRRFGRLDKLIDQLLDLLVVLGAGPGDDLVGRVAEGQPRLGDRVLQELHDIEHAPDLGDPQLVDGQLGKFFIRDRNVDLLEGLLDQHVILGPRPSDQLVGLRPRADLGLRHRQLENLYRAGRGDLVERVGHRLERLLGRIPHRKLVDDLLDPRLLGRPCPNDKLVRVGPLGGDRVGNRLAEHRRHRGGCHVFQVVHDQLARVLGPAVDLVDQLLDPLVILGPGPGDDLVFGHAGGEPGLRHALHQEPHHVVALAQVGRVQLVDDRLGLLFFRTLDVDLLEGLLDQGVILGPRPNDQLTGLRPRADLGLRHRQLENLHRAGRGDLVERVGHRLERLLGRILRRELVDRLLDVLVLVGPRPDDELVGIRAGRGERRRRDPLDHRRGRRGRRVLQVVNHQARLLVGRPFDVDLRQRLGDHFVVFGPCPGHELVQVRAGREHRLGRYLADHLHRRGGRDLGHRVVDGRRGRFGRLRRRELIDKGLNLLVVGGPGPDDELVGVHAGGRNCLRRHHPQHRRQDRRGDLLQLVDDRLRRVFLAPLDLLDDLGDLFVVLRPRPGDHLAGFEAGREFRTRHRFPEEPADVVQLAHLAGFQLVESERLRLVRGARDVDLLQGQLDQVLGLGRRQHDDLVAFRALADLGLGSGQLENPRGRGGVDILQRVGDGRRGQVGRIGRGQPIDDLLDLLVVGGPGPNDHLRRHGARRDHGVGEHLPQGQGDRGGGDVARIVDDRRRRVLLVGQLVDELLDLLVGLRPRPGDELLGACAGDERRLGHGFLEEADDVEHQPQIGCFELVDNRLLATAGRPLGVDPLERLLDLGVLVGPGENDQLVGVLALGDLRIRGNLGEDLLGRGGLERTERVGHGQRRFLRRRLGRHLLDRVADLLVLLLGRPDDQLAGIRAGAGDRARNDRLEHFHHALRRDLFERVDFHRRLAAGGFELGDRVLDLRLIGGPRPGDELAGVLADRELRMGDDAGEDLDRAGRTARLELVNLHDRRHFHRLFDDRLDQLLDRLVVFGPRPGDDLGRVGGERHARVGHGLANRPERVIAVIGVDSLQGVDGGRGLGALGSGDVDGFQGGLDRLVVLGAGPDEELLGVASGGELGLGHRQAENLHCTGDGDFLERVIHRHRLAGADGRRSHRLDRRASGLLVFVLGKHGEAVGLGVDDDLGRGDQTRQHLGDSSRRGIADRINHQVRLVGLVRPRLHLLDRLGDELVIALAPESDDLLPLQVGGDLHVGRQALQDADRRFRVDLVDRVGDGLLLVAAFFAGIHRLDRLGDFALLFRQRPDHQPIVLFIELQADFGKLALEHLLNGRRVGRTDRIDGQLGLRLGGALVLDRGQVLFDHGMTGGGGDDHQLPRVRVVGDRGFASQFPQPADQALRWRLAERVEPQLRRVRARGARIELCQGVLDDLVVFGHGQRHDAVGAVVERQLGFRRQVLKQLEDGPFIGVLHPVDGQRRRVFRRADLAQSGQRRLDRVVLLLGGEGEDVAGRTVDRHGRLGREFLQLLDHVAGGREAVSIAVAAVGVGPDRRHGVDLEEGLFLFGSRLVDLVQRVLDDLVVGGRRHDGQLPRVGVDADSRPRSKLPEPVGEGLRDIGLERVDFQLGRVARAGERQFVDRGLEDCMFLGGGEGGQASRLIVDRELGIRHERLQVGHERLEVIISPH